jgi:hypothetical protein
LSAVRWRRIAVSEGLDALTDCSRIMSVTPESPRGDKATGRAVMIGAATALAVVGVALIVAGIPAMGIVLLVLAPLLVVFFS